MSLPGKDDTHYRQSHCYFPLTLKGPKHRFYVHNHLLWAPVKRGWHGLESPKQSLEQEALGRVVGEQLWGFLSWDTPGVRSSQVSLEDQTCPRMKAMTLPCRILLLPKFGILLNPHCIFLLLFSSVFVCFICSFLFFFISPILYLYPCRGDNIQDSGSTRDRL